MELSTVGFKFKLGDFVQLRTPLHIGQTPLRIIERTFSERPNGWSILYRVRAVDYSSGEVGMVDQDEIEKWNQRKAHHGIEAVCDQEAKHGEETDKA